jgi:molecular chaperone DnaK
MNEALSELRGALGGSDIARIKDAHEKLAQVSQKAGSLLYAQQANAGGPTGGEQPGGAGAGTGAAPGSGPDDVVDAEIIDEDNKK